jgi:excinuclease ABC subunit C
MREAAGRRYARLVNEQADLPDLILIDGGIGQVNAVKGVLDSLNLDIPVAGLAKRDEEIYRPGDSVPMLLPKRSDALRLLQRIRDETHRFATSRNQRLRTKENTVSIFAELPHIGEKRSRTLMKTFATLEDLAVAEEAAIAQALHVRAPEAAEILMAAKGLLEQRRTQQAETRRLLKVSASTVQEAASRQRDSDLADSALEAAEKSPDYTI